MLWVISNEGGPKRNRKKLRGREKSRRRSASGTRNSRIRSSNEFRNSTSQVNLQCTWCVLRPRLGYLKGISIELAWGATVGLLGYLHILHTTAVAVLASVVALNKTVRITSIAHLIKGGLGNV
jgi:hypothetical protein